MRRWFIAAGVAAIFASAIALAASPAAGFPSFATPCATAGCHSGPAVTVNATQTSINGSVATYVITLSGGTSSGGYGWGLFQGATKVGSGSGSSATVTMTVGTTYTIYGVTGPTHTDGVGSITVTPQAPPADTTPPVTTATIQPVYTGSATIQLIAADVGGSGVANTFFTINGGAPTTGTVISVTTPGTYTVTFWSVDVAGNVETPHSATFVVQSPPPDTTPPVTTASIASTYTNSATINLVATDVGGSGVANTFFTINGGAATAGTVISVSTPGTYTVTYWSVDVAGNVEQAHTATFVVVQQSQPIQSTLTIRASVRIARRFRPFILSGVLTPGDPDEDELIVVEVKRPGSFRWSYSSTRRVYASVALPGGLSAGLWWYRYTPRLRGTYYFRARFAGEPGQTAAVSRVIGVPVR